MSDDVIVQLVEKLQRTFTGGGGVFPWMVMRYAPFEISEGGTRKAMVRLWREGRLHRVGGDGCRKGYLVLVRSSNLRMLPTVSRLRVA